MNLPEPAISGPRKPNTVVVYLALLLAFAANIALMWPYLSRPLQPNNQGHIITLTAFHNWQANGLFRLHATPMLTWPNPGDKYVHYYQRLADDQGNNYFVSYPTLSFVAAYAAFTCLSIAPDHHALTFVSILLVLLTAYLCYRLVVKHTGRGTAPATMAGFLAFTCICFYPAMQCNLSGFFPGLAVLPLWPLSILIYRNTTRSPAPPRPVALIGWGTLIAVMVLTDWLGLLVAGAFMAICFRSHRQLFLVTALSAGLALAVLFVQWCTISGTWPLAQALGLRFLERSGLFGQGYSDQGMGILNHQTYRVFFRHLHLNMNAFGYLLLTFLAIAFVNFRKQLAVRVLSRQTKELVLLLVLPATLHFLVLFNDNVIHINGWAKTAIPIAILLGLVFHRIAAAFETRRALALLLVLLPCVLFSFAGFSTWMPPAHDTARLEATAAFLRQQVSPDEAITLFHDDELIEHVMYLQFLSHRNLRFATSEDQAREWFGKSPHTRGVYIDFTEQKPTVLRMKRQNNP